MATQINSLKSIGGLFRNRLNMVQELIGVYRGDTATGREKWIKLKELVKGNRLNMVQELIGVYRGDTATGREKWIKLKELVKEKTAAASKSELARKMRVSKGYYTLEMAPPSSAEEMKRLTEEVKLLQQFMKPDVIKLLTVKQAWLMFLVGLEVAMWFFLGETIGKFHIVGYKTCV